MATLLNKAVITAIGMIGFVTHVQAALVNFSVSGDVNNALATFEPNDFGLGLGDTITVTGTFDDSVLTGSGSESVQFGLGSGNSMTLIVGNFTFNETDDTFFSSGFPELFFLGGSFDGINFDTTVGSFGFFNSAGSLNTFEGQDDNLGGFGGTWDAASFSVTPVPVPAAVWLFGSGLLGLVGVARRKQ